jgi:hypothetical protein
MALRSSVEERQRLLVRRFGEIPFDDPKEQWEGDDGSRIVLI